MSRPILAKRKRRIPKPAEVTWELVRQLAFARDGMKCLAAGKGGLRCGGGLQGAHIYGRGANPSLAMKLDPDNVVTLCRNHHLFWAHKAPPDYSAWITEVIGVIRLERLLLKARLAKRLRSRFDHQAHRLWLKAELAYYGGNS